MLEGKDYRTLDGAFPLVEAFIDRASELKDSSPMINVHLMYPELFLCMRKCGRVVRSWQMYVSNLECDNSKIEKLVNKLFEMHCDTGLNTLEFPIPDHLPEDGSRFETPEVLGRSGLEHFNAQVTVHTGQRREDILLSLRRLCI